MDLLPDADVSAADWWETSWEGDTPAAVGFLIPRGFEAYARLLHPSALGDGTPVPWAEVARACGTTLHPLAQWQRLAFHGDLDPRGEGPEPVRWTGGEPHKGCLDRGPFEALAEVLARHTTTPARTHVAFWVGYGFWPQEWRDMSSTRRLASESFLFQRAVAEVAPLCAEASWGWWSPSAWWPADHAWATSSDTDLDSTLIGGSRALVDELLGTDGLEVLPWAVDGSLWSNADTINRTVMHP